MNISMLGVFDSGFGGLTVLKPIHQRLPTLSTIYLGDNARAPYGVRSQEEIFQFTLEGVRFLFERGCPLVILACNTASAQALRRIQQDMLPLEYPDRRVLGVVRPAAEYLAKHATRVGLFATPATVESAAYVHELYDLNPTIKVTQVACPGLTDLIEAGRQDSPATDTLVAGCVRQLLATDEHIQEVLLACTHYPLVESVFRAHLPQAVHVLSQGDIVAASLESYLARHPKLDEQLQKTGERKYFTTNGSDVSGLASMFYGQEIQFEKVVIA
ncbi:MAG: glutamate racemase [Candidatus Uhrbacteria bacterium]|nr:glutamate racemase [Candidatus Uhrbacteria bacterium]